MKVITWLMNIYAIIYSMVVKSKFVKDMYKRLVYMDPDSSRFVESIWADRVARGLPTFSDIIDIPAINGVDSLYLIRKIVMPYVNTNFDFISTVQYRSMAADKKGVVTFFITAAPDKVLLMADSQSIIDSVKKEIEHTFKQPETIDVVKLISIDPPQQRNISLASDGQELGLDAFYPYIDGGVSGMIDAIRNKKAPVTIFIGEPGTGKSALIRSIMFGLKLPRTYLVADELCVLHPGFSGWLNSTPDGSFITVEDADNYIRAREDKNTQMTALLNFTQGIISTSSKVVISTNLTTLGDVDPALVRAGRTANIIHFRKLKGDEINKARAAISLPPIEVSNSTEMTLSTALNYENELLMGMVKKERSGSMGFC